MASGLSAALPLTVSIEDGPYRLNKTINELSTQNLKMVVLTNPGERIMNPDFGVGISRYLFEQAGSNAFDQIKSRISQQVGKYLSYINIMSINIGNFTELSNAVRIVITYNIQYSNEKLILDFIVTE
jgi:hypothetical protein